MEYFQFSLNEESFLKGLEVASVFYNELLSSHKLDSEESGWYASLKLKPIILQIYQFKFTAFQFELLTVTMTIIFIRMTSEDAQKMFNTKMKRLTLEGPPLPTKEFFPSCLNTECSSLLAGRATSRIPSVA
jgi:hypothetical protein